MGLNHDFILLDAETDGTWSVGRFIRDPRAVHLHDDVVGYLWDTLMWIPTLNPATGERGLGLNRWGPTAIEKDGAEIAAAVFSSWAQIFSLGPDPLDLKGPYVLEGFATSQDNPDSPPKIDGHYERLNIDRGVLLETLNQLSGWCARISTTNAREYLFHGGI